MRAVIAAAGASSRFWPLNDCHKSLIRIAGKTLIERAVDSLKGNVDEIVVVEPASGCISSNLDLPVEFRRQKEPRGTWEAIQIGAHDCDDDFIVLSGYHTSRDVVNLLLRGRGMKLLLTEVENPRDYGIVTLRDGRISEIVEKPTNPGSNLAVVSAYRFPPEFVDLMKKMADSAHPYLLEDALTEYVREHDVSYDVIPRDALPSLKYPWHALDFLEKILAGMKAGIEGDVAESAVLTGKVVVEEGARIMAGAVISGPAYIGKGAVVGNFSLVRESSVEAGAVVGSGSEIARSLVGKGVKLHHNYVGDSVLAEGSHMGYGAVTANLRLDGTAVRSMVKGKLVSTGRRKFGCVLGRGANVGVNAMIMPGVLVGRNARIYPGTVVRRNVEDGGVVK